MSDIETPPPPTVGTSFKDDVLNGLRATPKRIPSKYFYDERGAKLFEEITALPEYYLTRTEIGIFEECLPEIARELKSEQPFTLIEFGTGAGIKTEMLLTALQQAGAIPERFISIDISEEQLVQCARELEATFPGLRVHPLAADFTDHSSLFALHSSLTSKPVYFFPGSSIGNFTPKEATAFLASLPKPGTLLLGVDRVKDKRVIEAAYNDAQGITAAFNLNLIDRMKRELGADIPDGAFRHVACFNEANSRIEMHLETTRPLTIKIDDEAIPFASGERMLTEYSYKYSDAMLQDVLSNAGFTRKQIWTDPNSYFAVCLCESK
jgi:dimethylhistidine N-methyltransferase